MSDKTDIVKTVLEVTVLADGRIDNYDLETIGHEIVHGSWSGDIKIKETKILTRNELIEECDKQGTDVSFFLGEEENQ